MSREIPNSRCSSTELSGAAHRQTATDMESYRMLSQQLNTEETVNPTGDTNTINPSVNGHENTTPETHVIFHAAVLKSLYKGIYELLSPF